MNPSRISHFALAGIASALLLSTAGCSKPAPAVPVMPPSAGTAPAMMGDVALTKQVKAALRTDEGTKSFDIGVEALNGEVRLSGTLDNQQQVDQALAVARAVTGVRSVQDSLKLKL